MNTFTMPTTKARHPSVEHPFGVDSAGVVRTSQLPTDADRRDWNPHDGGVADPPTNGVPMTRRKRKPAAGTTNARNEAVDDPHRLARTLLSDQFTNAADERTLAYHDDEFHQHNGICYRRIPTPEVRTMLTAHIKAQFDVENQYLVGHPELWTETEAPKCRKVTVSMVTNTLAALQSMTLLPSTVQAPAWIGNGEQFAPANELMATKSGLLHLPRALLDEDCLHPPTARLFAFNGVDYQFDPNAGCPTWLAFLSSIWPLDRESQDTLQEIMGLLLTLDTRHHKLFMLIGPPRSGKGTIARAIKGLIGEGNMACPTLGSLAGPFGLWPLLGKSAALVSDARLSGRTDAVAVVERLLSISGEDPQDVHRKNMPTLAGLRMAVRFLLMTNELPNMRDASGALTSRMVLLRMTRSFLGSEDKTLGDRIAKELPGILNWALLGLHRLRERGAFLQPESGRELLADLDDLASPISQFTREVCHVGPEFSVRVDEAFAAWKSWCDEHGRENMGTRETFGRDLRAALPQISMSQSRYEGNRVRVYQGIGLRLDAPGTGWHARQSYAREG